MKATTVIAPTTKGARVFLQGVTALNMPTATYDVIFGDEHIMVWFKSDGKRTVSPSKGGVIDIQSQKVTAWARGATTATVWHDDTNIYIKRGA